MKLKYLSTAMILATLPATGAFAAALDRSGQSMSAFLQPGNYFEAGLSVLDADVSGTTKANYPNAALPLLSNTSVGEMADSYQFAHAALKLQLADQLSFGLIYDQPFEQKQPIQLIQQNYLLRFLVPLLHFKDKVHFIMALKELL